MLEPLAATDAGGDRPPIVLVHGLTFSKESWTPIVDRLGERFRCLAVDLPGHGRSQGSGSDPLGVVARIHATVLDHGLEQPVVVGHSYGAIHASAYAAEHETRGVVNVDQTLRVAPFVGIVQMLADGLRGPQFEGAFAPFVASIGVGQLPEPERHRVLGTQRIEQGLVLDYWDKSLTGDAAEVQSEVDALLGRITVPYLWLTGAAVEPADEEHLRAHVPQAQIESWPGLGHMLHLAEPDRFTERLARFAAPAAAAGFR